MVCSTLVYARSEYTIGTIRQFKKKDVGGVIVHQAVRARACEDCASNNESIVHTLRQAPKVCGYDTGILLLWHAPCSMRSNLWHASLKRLVASLSSVVAATAASILAKSAP